MMLKDYLHKQPEMPKYSGNRLHDIIILNEVSYEVNKE